MASEVDIANRALQKLGEARISSLTENSKAARAMNAAFEIVRDAELRAHRWNFATKRVQLSPLTETPLFGFTKAFQLPSDCLRVLQIGSIRLDLSLTNYRNGLESLYQIEGRKIFTDLAAPLDLIYVSKVTDTGLMDSLFIESFATRLAIETCDELTQSTTKKNDLKKDYVRGLRAAKLADAIENPPEAIADSGWVLARL